MTLSWEHSSFLNTSWFYIKRHLIISIDQSPS